MKNTKRMAAFMVLALLSMMFTSCKAVVGNGDMTVLYVIANIVIAAGFVALDFFLDGKIVAKYGKQKEPDSKSFAMISGTLEILLLVAIFLLRPFKFFNVLVLAVILVITAADKNIKIKKAKEAAMENQSNPQE